MKTCFYLMLTIFLVGCASTEVKDTPQTAKQTDAEEQAEVPISRRIYYLQHKLISDWLYQSDGAFFFDLQNGNAARLLLAASEIVTPDYADGIYIRPVEGADAVAITFPKPEEPALCYYALMLKEGEGYAYFTYEKAINFNNESNIGEVGIVGGWDREGNHENYGIRTYMSESEFIADIVGQQRQ